LFDKTGTITTDRLIAEQLVSFSLAASPPVNNISSVPVPTDTYTVTVQSSSLREAPFSAQLAVACCHSVMQLEKTYTVKTPIKVLLTDPTAIPAKTFTKRVFIGDPLEVALLESLQGATADTDGVITGPGTNAVSSTFWGFDTRAKTATLSKPVDAAGRDDNAVIEPISVRTLRTFEFNADLQRMTVLAHVNRSVRDTTTTSTSSSSTRAVGHHYLVASKGSPESILHCLKDEQRLDPKFTVRYQKIRIEPGLRRSSLCVLCCMSLSMLPNNPSSHNPWVSIS
jgi:magnesium-transporting ATPase (P-type)